MATAIGLGMQLTADSADMTEGLSEAEKALAKLQAQAERNAKTFREFSGIVSLLPGAIGNVAGRLSGFISAGDGLKEIFSSGVSGGIRSVGTAISGIVNPFTLAAAGIAGAGVAASAVVSNLAALEQRTKGLGIEAERLGVSFDFIQVLDEAARRSGSSIEALGTGLQRFGATIEQARSGSGAAAEAFARLGISQEQLASSDITQTAIQTAQAIERIEDPAQRAALQLAVFGKSGEDLRRALADLPSSAAALERFAGSVSTLNAQRLNDFGRAFDDLRTALSSLGNNLSLPFTNLASGVTQALAEIIGGVSAIAAPIGTALAPFLDIIGLLAETFGQAVGGVLQFVGNALQPLVKWAERASRAIGQVREYLRGVREEGTGNINTGGSQVTQQIEPARLGVEQINQEVAKGQQALDRAIASAGDYGQAGFNAAFRFQEGLADLDEQLKANELTSEQYARGLGNLQAQFDREIAGAKEAAKAEEERRRAVERAIEADRQRADRAIESVTVDLEFGGDRNRFEASQTVDAIERERVRVEEQIAQARADGDKEAERAATRRLAQLDQALARERDIASGVSEQLKLQREYDAERARIDVDRLRELSRPTTQLAQVQDVRTSQGYDALLNMRGGEDPAIKEYQKQTAELKKIGAKLDALRTGTAEIL